MSLRRQDAAPKDHDARKPNGGLNGTKLGHRPPTTNPGETARQTAPPPPNRNWGLFLDFDGTLIEFADRPDEVVVAPELRELLARLHHVMKGAVAVISGRTLASLDQLIGLPFLPMAGQHGLEWRDSAGHVSRVEVEPIPMELIEAAQSWCESHDGTLIEVKDFAVAIHVRGKPELFGEALSLGRALASQMPDRLMVQIGVEVVEVRRAGANKGSAVASLMRDDPFVGRLPVFVGDDRTDEDGFAEAAKVGGFGLLVGPGRPSIARHRLRRPANVRQWLALLTRDTGL